MINIVRGPTIEPLRILLHGQEGVGKTSFVAACPDALCLTAEDGGGDLDYARVVLPTWDDLRGAVVDLIRDPQGFHTISIDTIDAYERLLWAKICDRANCDTIEEVGGGYGKGYTAAAEEMASLIGDLDALRRRHKVNVIVLAHSHVRPFNDPMGAPYDRYEVRLHKGTAALWKDWSDAILFACFDVTVMKAGRKGRAVEAGPLEKGKAVDSGKRVIYTSKEAAYDAKNRHNLPDELPLGWRPFADAIQWDKRDAAIRVPPAPKHHPTWDADRARFCAALGDLGDPYVVGGGRNLYDAVRDFIVASNLPKPSMVSTESRNKYLALLALPAARDAFRAWDAEGATPDLKAIGATLRNDTPNK